MEDLGLIDINQEINEIEEAHIPVQRNPKIYLERKNPLTIYDDSQFRRKYRMTKRVAEYIINLIRDEISNAASNRGCPISAEVQVLSTIRYLAKGAYGDDVAELHGLSQPALSIIIKRVVEALAGHRGRFIKFPENEELQRTNADFFNIAQCPNVVGVIDCTHIKIKNPGGENHLLYLNRKRFYSLNVQVVSDAKFCVTDIVARWRGSTHDSRIWNESTLKRKFEHGEIDGILLEDSGYPCSRYLLTPVLNPTTNAQTRYNRAHVTTRNLTERVFGVIKNRFRCFFNGLHLNLDTTKAAIVAIAIIHNIIINDRLENEDNQEEDEGAADDIENDVVENNRQGNIFRQQYINNHFN